MELLVLFFIHLGIHFDPKWLPGGFEMSFRSRYCYGRLPHGCRQVGCGKFKLRNLPAGFQHINHCSRGSDSQGVASRCLNCFFQHKFSIRVSKPVFDSSTPRLLAHTSPRDVHIFMFITRWRGGGARPRLVTAESATSPCKRFPSGTSAPRHSRAELRPTRPEPRWKGRSGDSLGHTGAACWDSFIKAETRVVDASS